MSTDALVPVTFPRLGPTSGQDIDDVAFARGHAAGYAYGLSLARVELAERKVAADAEAEEARVRAEAVATRRLRALDAATRALEARTAPVLAEARGQILDIAFSTAEELIGHTLKDGQASARAAVARALQGTAGEEVRAVRLHPADLALLQADDVDRPGLVLVADTSLERGDAVTDLPQGSIDARLSTALGRVRAVLRDSGVAGSGAS
ncbi:hypothetical protein GM708_05495 [Vibrio cholerae]|nr:hypothetical protein [Vibrio cholerae]